MHRHFGVINDIFCDCSVNKFIILLMSCLRSEHGGKDRIIAFRFNVDMCGVHLQYNFITHSRKAVGRNDFLFIL